MCILEPEGNAVSFKTEARQIKRSVKYHTPTLVAQDSRALSYCCLLRGLIESLVKYSLERKDFPMRFFPFCHFKASGRLERNFEDQITA